MYYFWLFFLSVNFLIDILPKVQALCQRLSSLNFLTLANNLHLRFPLIYTTFFAWKYWFKLTHFRCFLASYSLVFFLCDLNRTIIANNLRLRFPLIYTTFVAWKYWFKLTHFRCFLALYSLDFFLSDLNRTTIGPCALISWLKNLHSARTRPYWKAEKCHVTYISTQSRSA